MYCSRCCNCISYKNWRCKFNSLIHIDHEYAKKTRFNQRIAHGLLTSSLLSQLLGIHLPGKGSVSVIVLLHDAF
ncbi:MaoC/PaaZ C-terminal domain-containing protein, partial [Bacillus sp. B-TM1]